MSPPIGLPGAFGVLIVFAGIGIIAYVDPLIAAGLAAILIGLALLVRDLISRMLASFGLSGAI